MFRAEFCFEIRKPICGFGDRLVRSLTDMSTIYLDSEGLGFKAKARTIIALKFALETAEFFPQPHIL